MPVTMPAEGASSPYMPCAASCENSRKGAPGSSSPRTRSRGNNFPRLVCFFWASGPPPSEARATCLRRSSTSARWCVAFAANPGEPVSRRDLMTGTSGFLEGSVGKAQRDRDAGGADEPARLAAEEQVQDTHGHGNLAQRAADDQRAHEDRADRGIGNPARADRRVVRVEPLLE